MYITYIIYYYFCLPLYAHLLYFGAAKFSVKLFSLIYFTVSVVKQRNEYEKVTVTQPIKTITSSTFQDINLHKNPDNRAVVW